MVLDAHHNIYMPPCTSPHTVHDVGGGKIIVLNTAELEAAGHVAHRHVISIDHADQLGAWPRLAHHAQADQSTQSIHAARRR